MKHIEVCCGGECLSKGSEKVFDVLDKKYSSAGIEVTMCSCLGHCKKGPNVLVDESTIIHYTSAQSVVGKIKKGEGTPFKRPTEQDIFDVLDDLT